MEVDLPRARPSLKRQRRYVRSFKKKRRYTKRIPAYTGETKFHDVEVNDAVIAGGGTIQNAGSINLIAQGVTESTRVGRKCVISAINWRWQVKLPAATAAASTVDEVRLIMYQDKQANGATATTTDILEAVTVHGFRNLSNVNRFKILYDERMTLKAGGAAPSGAALVFSEDMKIGAFYKKCNIPLEFSATTGAITEIRSNNIGILALSDEGLCELDSDVRLRFTDGG